MLGGAGQWQRVNGKMMLPISKYFLEEMKTTFTFTLQLNISTINSVIFKMENYKLCHSDFGFFSHYQIKYFFKAETTKLNGSSSLLSLNKV